MNTFYRNILIVLLSVTIGSSASVVFAQNKSEFIDSSRSEWYPLRSYISSYNQNLESYRQSIGDAASVIDAELSGTSLGRVEPNNDALRRSTYSAIARMKNYRYKLEQSIDVLKQIQNSNTSHTISPVLFDPIEKLISESDPRAELNNQIHRSLVNTLTAQADWYQYTNNSEAPIAYYAGNYLFASPVDDYRYHVYLGSARAGIYALTGYNTGIIQRLAKQSPEYAQFIHDELSVFTGKFEQSAQSVLTQPCRVGYMMRIDSGIDLGTHCPALSRDIASRMHSSAALESLDRQIASSLQKFTRSIVSKPALKKFRINTLANQAGLLQRLYRQQDDLVGSYFAVPKNRSEVPAGPYGSYALYAMDKAQFAEAIESLKLDSAQRLAPWMLANLLTANIRDPFTIAVVGKPKSYVVTVQKQSTIPQKPYAPRSLMWYFDRYRTLYPVLDGKSIPIIDIVEHR